MQKNDYKSRLREGDYKWIAENLDGNYESNRVYVHRVLSCKTKATGKKAKRIIELTLLRIDINENAKKIVDNNNNHKPTL